jgi:hypothetical protein
MIRSFLLLLSSTLFLTGCFTGELLYKCKQDKKREHVKALIASYKDSIGNTIIIYTKRHTKHVYREVVPLDTIISRFERTDINYHYYDLNTDNFKDLTVIRNFKDTNSTYGLVYLKKETPLKDTAGLYLEKEKDQHLVRINKERTPFPSRIWHKNAYESQEQAVSFIVQNNPDGNRHKVFTNTYRIAIPPQRRKRTRYLLVPFTGVADVVTSPFQAVYFGLLWLSYREEHRATKP